jgi:hypothetical protein
MSKRYFEAHVTFTAGDNSRTTDPTYWARFLVERNKWKFSQISGDANLGPGAKMYATRQMNERIGVDEAIKQLEAMATILDKSPETDTYKVLRKKIELVLFDDRSDLVPACNGACYECIGDEPEQNIDVR